MANTHSTNLVSASSQTWSITDGDQTGLDITGDFTFEFWFSMDDKTQSNIIDKWVGGGNQRAYQIVFNDNGINPDKFEIFTTSNGSIDTQDRLGYTGSFSVDTWYHLAISFDASASEYKFYIDSSNVSTQSGSNNAVYNSSSAFIFGNSYDGLLDELRVWNDVRTPTEIADNYQKELVGDEAGLVGYWKFNNDGLDETSNNNDFTNNNACTFSADVPTWEEGTGAITAPMMLTMGVG